METNTSPGDYTGIYTGISDFLHDRAAWLRVMAVETGHGVDIVLRLDGSYAPPGEIAAVLGEDVEAGLGSSEDMADHFRAQLEPILIDMGLGPKLTDWTPRG